MNENRAYSLRQRHHEPAAMTKHQTSGNHDFGMRLAQLRKAAGYTQHQLAAEIDSTRRKIAYYESESEHPPADLLADLARALNVSIDDLLGVSSRKKSAAKTVHISARLERRMRQIETLAPRTKQQLLGVIDTFIAASRPGAKS